ncbi:MAG: LolA family protein [Paracoccaceae bacterium]
MFIVKIILFIASLLCLAGNSVAFEKISLKHISEYLMRSDKLYGEFIQINDDKTTSTGKVFVLRPGRMRIEYETPDNSLIIVGGSRITVFDSRSNTYPREYSLNKTPLKLLLKKEINLSGSKSILSYTRNGQFTEVLLHDPKSPTLGQLMLKFVDHPISLREWVITNSTGEKTTLEFKSLSDTHDLTDDYFNTSIELDRRKNQ